MSKTWATQYVSSNTTENVYLQLVLEAYKQYCYLHRTPIARHNSSLSENTALVMNIGFYCTLLENTPTNGGFPWQRASNIFIFLFSQTLNKPSSCRWLHTPWRSLCSYCNLKWFVNSVCQLIISNDIKGNDHSALYMLCLISFWELSRTYTEKDRITLPFIGVFLLYRAIHRMVSPIRGLL